MIQTNRDVAVDSDAGYGQIFSILFRRRFWFLGIFFSIVVIATILALLKPLSYKSSMQLLVESNYRGKAEEVDNSSGQQFIDSNLAKDEADNATQLNLMRSSRLLQKVVDLLKPEYPELTIKDIKGTLTVSQVVEEGKGGKVNTKIFEVAYSSDDPVMAQKVLEATKRVYQDYNLEQQKLRLSKGLSFVNEQLPQVQNRLNQASANLQLFRKENDLIDPEVKSKALVEALNSVQQERRTNDAQLKDFQGRYIALQKQLDRSPEEAIAASRLSQSLRYQEILSQIQKNDVELAQQRLRLTDSALPVQRLQEKRRSLLALAKQEVQQILPKSRGNASKKGQFGQTDINITEKLAEAQVNLTALESRAQSLAAAEQRFRTELKQLPKLLAAYDRLLPEVRASRETLDQLLKAKQKLSLGIARGGFDWQIVEEPQLGQKTGNRVSDLLIGAIVGLMLGAAAAFIRESSDDVIHTTDELGEQSDLPILGTMPTLSQGAISQGMIALPNRVLALPAPSKAEAKSLAASESKYPLVSRVIGKLPQYKSQAQLPSMVQVLYWTPFRESLDVIFQSIHFSSGTPVKSVVITSALPGAGKSTLALGLAMSAARLHQRVLLIDADLRRPTIHEQFNLPNRKGLSTLLGHEASFQDESIIHREDNISILTSGPVSTDPATLLSSPRMKNLMKAFEQNYDLVVLDTPPVLGMVDATLAASLCDGVVMVGRIDQATRAEHREAVNLLKRFNVLGVVANGVKLSNKRYQIYSSYYNSANEE
jgi:polysaccharide biosynthesis transport protein